MSAVTWIVSRQKSLDGLEMSWNDDERALRASEKRMNNNEMKMFQQASFLNFLFVTTYLSIKIYIQK